MQQSSGQQNQRYGRLNKKPQRTKGKRRVNKKHEQERNVTADAQNEGLATKDHLEDNTQKEDLEEYKDEENSNDYRTDTGRTGSGNKR